MQKSFLQSGKISDLIKSKKPLIMGILNVTPDSFSDGGNFVQIENAIKQAEKLIKDGADIIDIGGESTRPGAELVSEEEELKRVIPVIYELKKRFPDILISIDTYKSNVAQLALNAGAKIINDVSGLTMDPDMVVVAAKANCPIVIMHNNGIPATKPKPRVEKNKMSFPGLTRESSYNIDDSPNLDSRFRGNDNLKSKILNEVYKWLQKQTDFAIANGIKKENIIIDPGIGFGKSAKENLHLIENLQEFKLLGFPILVGPSRKSFIRELFGEEDLEAKSKEVVELAVKNGADIVRIHKVNRQF